jgi:hypothetical protein
MKVLRIISLVLILVILLILHFVKFGDADLSQHRPGTHNGYPY